MKKLIAILLLISTPAFAEVQYKSQDTPNTTSTIGTIPVFLSNGVIKAVSDANPLPTSASVTIPAGGSTLAAQATGNTSLASIDGKITAVNTGAVTQATGSTVKTADRSGNVFTGTQVGLGYPMDVNIRSGTPTTMAVTNAGVFAVQNTGATGSTSKVADRAGNVFTGTQVGLGYLLDVNIRSGTPTTVTNTPATGSTVKGADRSGNVFTGSVTTGGNYAMDVKTATGSTLQSATGSVTQTIVGIDNGWSAATQSTLSSVVQTIKSTKGNFGGYFFYNQNSSATYLQVFDATSVANATLTTLKMIIGLPATAGANMEWSRGVSFNKGIYVRAATTATGNTAPSSPIEGFIAYK